MPSASASLAKPGLPNPRLPRLSKTAALTRLRRVRSAKLTAARRRRVRAAVLVASLARPTGEQQVATAPLTGSVFFVEAGMSYLTFAEQASPLPASPKGTLPVNGAVTVAEQGILARYLLLLATCSLREQEQVASKSK